MSGIEVSGKKEWRRGIKKKRYIFVVFLHEWERQRMNHSTAFDAIAPEVIKVKECVLGAGKLLLFRLLASFGKWTDKELN